MSNKIGTLSTEEYVQGLDALGGKLEEFLKALKDAGVDRVTVDEQVHEIAIKIINQTDRGKCTCEVVW